VERIWGSLQGEDGKAAVGEIWWLFHDRSGSSSLRALDGGKLTCAADLLDEGRLPGNPFFPVLIKTLHTADRLSVQVHPGKEGSEPCKEETWVVLDASPGAWMLGGFSHSSSREELLESIDSGELEKVLAKWQLHEGDTIHLPPGTVHALGEGLTILEVQRNCDVTFRLFDWGRTGVNGLPRDLHLEEGLTSVNFDPCSGPLFAAGGVLPDEVLDEAVYSLTPFAGPGVVDMPQGGAFFLSRGTLSALGVDMDAFSCLLADCDGGVLELATGAHGWIVGVK